MEYQEELLEGSPLGVCASMVKKEIDTMVEKGKCEEGNVMEIELRALAFTPIYFVLGSQWLPPHMLRVTKPNSPFAFCVFGC